MLDHEDYMNTYCNTAILQYCNTAILEYWNTVILEYCNTDISACVHSGVDTSDHQVKVDTGTYITPLETSQ